MPTQAKANNLVLEPIPIELRDLNSMEIRLISLRIPFMKMMALPCGKQKEIHGPAVKSKGHYMYEYIRQLKSWLLWNGSRTIIPSIRTLRLINSGLEMMPLMIVSFGRLSHHSSLVSNPFPQIWSNLRHSILYSSSLLRMPLPHVLNNLWYRVLYSSN